ncbi:MAG: glycosyltransferase family A protein, partial [Gemmatimonadaceae bacterium]
MGQLSLVVCTRNRSAQLGVTLQRLMRLAFPDSWELVIVDNGSTDATKEVIATLLKDHPRHVTPVVVTDPKPGLGRARNSGWKK